MSNLSLQYLKNRLKLTVQIKQSNCLYMYIKNEERVNVSNVHENAKKIKNVKNKRNRG